MNSCGLVPLTNAEGVEFLENLYRDPAVARVDEPPATRAVAERLDGRIPRGLRHRAGGRIRHV